MNATRTSYRNPEHQNQYLEDYRSSRDTTRKEISVVLPVYNEVGNLRSQFTELKRILDGNFSSWEVIFVDDGSTDGSHDELRRIAEVNTTVKIIKFRTNFGQSAALDAGLKHATGNVIITMDADGQNDPADIPRLVEKLNEGYDCVCGWRKQRHDPLEKRVFSKIAHQIRGTVLGTDLHDYGCTLKALSADAAGELDIVGEMHRYIPPLLSWRGYRIEEIEVNHRPRENGDTKYGLSRIPKGFIDLINVWFWRKYSARPLHIFGSLGIIAASIGILSGIYSTYLKYFENVSLSDTALPLLAVFLTLVGIQFFISGILADITSKNYFAVRNTERYRVHYVLESDSESKRLSESTNIVDHE